MTRHVSVAQKQYSGPGSQEGDGAQGDEALEGAEGNGDKRGIFRKAAHENGAKEVLCMLVICRDKVLLYPAGISERDCFGQQYATLSDPKSRLDCDFP